jgi:hypothetical protein
MGLPIAASGDVHQALSIGQVTGGQPLEDWLKKLMAQDDDIYRMQHFVQLFDALNNVEDIKTALKVMAPNGRGRGMRFTEYSMLLQKLTQLDPKEAIAYASAQNGGERYMATGTVVRTWAKSQPEAALAWAKENGAPQNPDDQNNNNNRGPGGGNDNWALASVVTQLAKTNLDKAIQEAGSNDLGRTSGRTADALLNEAIDQRGLDAAKKIVDSLPEGQFRNDYVQQLASKLAEKDPAGAVKWVMTNVSGDSKGRTLSEPVGNWLKCDQAAALTFLKGMPVGPDYDSPRVTATQQLARTNPTEALTQLASISDPQRQARVLGETARDISRKDMNAAQQFVAASTVADEMKQQISQSLAQRAQGGPGGPGGPGGFGFGNRGGGGFRRGGGN